MISLEDRIGMCGLSIQERDEIRAPGRPCTWLQLLFALTFMIPAGVLAEEPQTAIERRGEAVLTEFCSRCHAVGRRGDSPHPAAPAFRHISRRYSIEALRQKMEEGMFMSGHPDMPTFHFRREDVKPVIAYLLAIQSD